MKAQHLSTQEVCLFLGISLSTLYRYCKRGLLKPSFFTSGGHRRFDLHTIKQAFNIDNSAELVVCYSRVSSHDQKKDLATQENKLIAYAQSLNLSNNKKIISINDLGSGLNYKKKGLKQLLNLILLGKVQTLILNHKDRLLRFGSEIIFSLCKHMKVNVIVLEAKKEITFEEELSSDVIELMTVFCAKLYGKRSHKNKLHNTPNMCYNPYVTE
jgi:predicted site-specific integrase-resolvase